MVPNSVKVVNGQYVENDIPIVHWGGASSAVNTYYNNASNYAQYRNWILPKDYLKLREITLSYSLPKAWLKQTPFSMVQVSLIGRNLFMWTPKKNNYVDPEGTNYVMTSCLKLVNLVRLRQTVRLVVVLKLYYNK